MLADISYVDPTSVMRLETSAVFAAAATSQENAERMHQGPIKIENLQQLRQLVSHTLCQQNDFEEGIFQVTERVLTRGNKNCGIFFCLHGPRSVKLTAVWETESNTILFYGSTGERFKKTVLSTSPKIRSN